MSLGTRLRQQLDHRQQKEIAASWCDRWNSAHTDKPMRPEYVIQQLSRCLNDKARGVRFFFGNESERAELLFEVLECSPEERNEISAAASEFLGSEPPPPSALFDLTSWTSEKAFATALETVGKLLDLKPTPAPVTLLVTESQYQKIPLGLGQRDEVRCEVSRERVRGHIQELAGESTLVISARDYEPVERWLACEITSYGSVYLEPRDGFAQFLEHGVLLGPAIPEPSLAVLGVELEDDIELPSSPRERRRLWFELADPHSTLNSDNVPEYRRALAHALGASAALTPEERDAWEFDLLRAALKQELAVEKIETTYEGALAQELRCRRLFKKANSVVEVGKAFHVLLDPDGETPSIPDSARVHVHRPRLCNPIQDFFDELATWTVEDYCQDPYYDRLLQRLIPHEEAEPLYQHARSFLLLTGSRPQHAIKSEKAAWDTALQSIISEGPPRAQLAVQVDATPAKSKKAGRPTIWFERHRAQPETKRSDLTKLRSITYPAAVNVSFIGREDRVNLVSSSYSISGFAAGYDGSVRPPASTLFCLKLEDGDPVATWRGLVRGSSDLTGRLDDNLVERENERGFRRVEKDTNWGHKEVGYARTRDSIWLLESWNSNSRELDLEIDWRRLDHELGVLWMILAQALHRGTSVTLHDGSVLLALGGSMFARLRSTSWPTGVNDPLRRACFVAVPDSQAKSLQIHRTTHYTHQASTGGVTTQIGLDLPSKLSLFGAGYVVDLEFTATPLGGALDTATQITGAASASVASHLAREEEEARRRMYDDDD